MQIHPTCKQHAKALRYRYTPSISRGKNRFGCWIKRSTRQKHPPYPGGCFCLVAQDWETRTGPFCFFARKGFLPAGLFSCRRQASALCGALLRAFLRPGPLQKRLYFFAVAFQVGDVVQHFQFRIDQGDQSSVGSVVAQVYGQRGNGGEKIGGTDQVLRNIVIVLDKRERQMLLCDNLFQLRQKIPADLRVQKGLRRYLSDRNFAFCARLLLSGTERYTWSRRNGTLWTRASRTRCGVTIKS